MTPEGPTFSTTVYANTDYSPGPNIAQRLTPSVSRFHQAMTALSQQMRVAVPAVVVSFSPGPPATISARVAITDKIQWNNNGPDVSADNPINIVVQAMTPGLVLEDIPVAIYGAGGLAITLPIQKGDECILLFADLEIDAWLQNGAAGQAVNTVTSRRHDLSDAIAVFGLWSAPRALPNYSTGSLQIRSLDGSMVIDMNMKTGAISLTAPTININGDLIVNSNHFATHAHVGVKSGTDDTGPVAPPGP